MAQDAPTVIFSVDVEDWFHILALPSAPDFNAWDALPSRVEANFRRMLDLFDEYGAKVTCFFLGWVAKRYPALVKEAQARGHEVASHGYAHGLAYELSPSSFYEDVSHAKAILEDVVGVPVCGYRAPGFSVTLETPWFFEELARAGYTYDSSVFPASRQHGGLKIDKLGPHDIETAHGTIREFPITVASVFGRPMCFFGGGYLRLFPYAVTRSMTNVVLAAGRPPIFYVHPREIDPTHPRLPMNPLRRFKSYVGLRTTERKIRTILRDYRVQTFANYSANNALPLPEFLT